MIINYDEVDAVVSSNEEEEFFILFNKLSGALVMAVSGTDESQINTEYYNFKKVKYNPQTHQYVGDYDTGGVVDKVNQPRSVHEQYMDDKAGMSIRKKFPYYAQLNVMRNAISAIADSGSVTGDAITALTDMNTAIEEILEMNERWKQSYKDDPTFNYISKQDAIDALDAQAQGGLHEVVGLDVSQDDEVIK